MPVREHKEGISVEEDFALGQIESDRAKTKAVDRARRRKQ